ncbi:MAG: integrase family protein [Microvirga sp.]|nr:integrase family protein [Microvirga sp.]
MHVNQETHPQHEPWNAGRIVGAKPPLKPKHIRALRAAAADCQSGARPRHAQPCHRQQAARLGSGCTEGRRRLLGQQHSREISGGPAQDRPAGSLRYHGADEARTRCLVRNSAHKGKRLALAEPKPQRGHVTTRQYGRLVDQWVSLSGLNPTDYGTHSLRRTKVSILCKRTGNLRASQLLLGHTKLESTVRYLGDRRR